MKIVVVYGHVMGDAVSEVAQDFNTIMDSFGLQAAGPFRERYSETGWPNADLFKIPTENM